MKKIILSLALAIIASQAIAQKNEITYRSFQKDVKQQDTIQTIIYRNQDQIAIQTPLDLQEYNPIQGLPFETNFIDYQNKTITRQLEYNDGLTYTATVSIPENKNLTLQGEETILGYKCQKYTTSINSNSIEIWVTQDLKMSATPIPQFACLPGVMIQYTRNGSQITQLHSNIKLSKKAKILTQPNQEANQVTYRQLDQIEKDKKVITTHIFNKERIHWGDTTHHQGPMPFDTTIHFAGGTLILKRINLQVLPEHYQLFAELTTQSSGDAYDRTGSIFIIPQDSITLYDALTKGIENIPYFTSKKENKYQGMIATPHYSPVVELIRFFTPFGVGHFNDRVQIDGLEWQEEVYYKQEITDLKPFLQGDVLIGAFIGNYDGGGHLLSLDLKAYPGDYVNQITPQRQWTLPLFNTCNVMEMAGQNYPHFFDTDTLSVTFEIPEGVNKLKLRYISTGHGGWGGGDEFNPKPNNIIIDDTIIYQYTPWREDCGRYREWNPVSGNFWNGLSSSDLSRSGWCPGTATQPTYIYLDNLTPGIHTIKIAIPQGAAEGGSFSSWSVSGVLIGE